MVLPLRAGGEGLFREPSPANTYGGACCADNAGKDRQCWVILWEMMFQLKLQYCPCNLKYPNKRTETFVSAVDKNFPNSLSVRYCKHGRTAWVGSVHMDTLGCS